MRTAVALLLVVVLGVPMPLAAQGDSSGNLADAIPGDRVNVELVSGARFLARLVEVRADAFVVDDVDAGRRLADLPFAAPTGRSAVVAVPRSDVRSGDVLVQVTRYERRPDQAVDRLAVRTVAQRLGPGRTVEIRPAGAKRFRARIVSVDEQALTLARGSRRPATTLPLDAVAAIRPASRPLAAQMAIAVGAVYAALGLALLACISSGSCVD